MHILQALDKPFHVSFEITNQCNLRCDFCSARLTECHRKDLSTNEILKIISILASEEIFSIFLTGGEPFLRKDLPIIVKNCSDRGINVTLSTNGTTVTKEVAETISRSGLDEIQVSIHADNKVHDKMVGIDGSIGNAMSGLENLLSSGIKVTVASVVTRRNYNRLPSLVRKVAKMGVSYFRVLRLMPHSNKMLKDIVPYNEMESLVKELSKIEDELGNISIIVTSSPGFIEKFGEGRQQYKILHPLCHTCTAGKMAMGILSDGNCVPCLELRDAQFICGNILQNSISNIWKSDQMSQLRSVLPNQYIGFCGKCEWKWSCYSARCVAYNIGENLFGDDVSCYFIKE